MSEHRQAPGGTPKLSQPLRSQADFEQACLWAIGHTLQARSRRMTWVDPDFSTWPLDRPELLQGLTTWLQLPQRRLVLIARDYAAVARRCPRFVEWRRTWSHAVEAWSPGTGEDAALPTLLIDDASLHVQRFDPGTGRGRAGLDESAVRQWAGEIDALLQRCEAAFPAHHLGL